MNQLSHNEPHQHWNSISGELVTGAERELSAFSSAVAELFGPEQAALAAEDWLQQLDVMTNLPESPREWRALSIEASARLAKRVDTNRYSEQKNVVRNSNTSTQNNRSRLKARTGDSLRTALCLLVFCVLPSASRAQVPVYEVTPVESTIRFGVESSVPIKGTFDKWNANVTFSSTDVRTGVLDIEIVANSVNTGSAMKNGKLRSKDFFSVKDFPMITFKSTNVVQTGPNTFDLEGDFTIRGVTKTERLTLTSTGKGTPSGSIDGTMAFDRKDYGMNSNIPFIKIANRVEVTVSLKWKQVSGPPLLFQQ